MRLRSTFGLVSLALVAATSLAQAGSHGRGRWHRWHPGHGHAAARYDSTVPRAWADLLYAAIRDEKLNPPLASRVIGYFGVALYESVVPGMPGNRSLGGQLNELPYPVVIGHGHGRQSWPLAANAALARVLHGLFPTASAPTAAAIDALELQLIADFALEETVPAAVAARSVARGRALADAVLAWAAGDGLATVVSAPYTPPVGPGLWQPTPPANVLNPLLPHWGEMRPFALLTADEIEPPAPPAYDTTPGSYFHTQAMEVYDTVNGLTAEQLAIAKFWADAGAGTGTPPGHWVRILSQIAAAEDLSLDVVAEGYARLGIAVADAFISCWHTKFLTNVLRPVTYIRAEIDAGWLPPIPTPPFPSYTSGHSTQSGATSYVLVDLLGEIPFEDHTHDALALPARSFSGFTEAAEEAALSRLYGGIHYSFDNDAGLEAGRDIGRRILKTVHFQKRRCGCSCR